MPLNSRTDRRQPVHSVRCRHLLGHGSGVHFPGHGTETAFERPTHLGNAIGTMQSVGSGFVPRWIRVYDPIKDLIAQLQRNGIDVWMVTTSPQFVVQAWVGEVGVLPIMW